jgi:uncharacterized protein involved in outer membrane biogenesis
LGKRIIVGVALATGGLLIVAVLNINFLVRRNQNYLVARLEQALGRQVSVDRIEVTLWPFGARLTNVVVAEDPAISPGEFLRANGLRVVPRILPLLMGRFELDTMEVDSPSITVLRSAEGRYSFSGAGGKEKPGRAAEREKILSREKADTALFLTVSLAVSNGTLNYRDLGSGGELTVTRIDLKTNVVDWREPVDIELAAAVMSAKPNLKFKSRIGPFAGVRDYRDLPLHGVIEAEALDLGKVNKAMPQLRRALPRALRFDGVYTIQELKFKGTLNHLSLKGAVTGTDASFRFE